MIAGVGHVESAAAGLARHGLDDALRERVAAGPAGRRDLRRDAAPLRRERGGWRGPRPARRPGATPAGPARAAHGLEHARRVAGPSRSSTGSTARTSTSPTATRPSPTTRSVVAATVDHDGPVVAAVEDGPLAGVQFHPERSGRAGRPRPREPRCDGQEARDPLPRRRRRARRQGRQLREPARDGRAGRAGAPLLGARRRRARLPRHHRDARGSRADPRA